MYSVYHFYVIDSTWFKGRFGDKLWGINDLFFTATASFYFFCLLHIAPYSYCWQIHLSTEQMPNVVNLLLVWSMSVWMIHVKKCCPFTYWIVCNIGCEQKNLICKFRNVKHVAGPVTNFYCAIIKSDLSRCNWTGGCDKGNGLNQDKIRNSWLCESSKTWISTTMTNYLNKFIDFSDSNVTSQ